MKRTSKTKKERNSRKTSVPVNKLMIRITRRSPGRPAKANKGGIPKTIPQLHAMSLRAQADWEMTLKGVRIMQEKKVSAPRAASQVGLSYAKFRKLAKNALKKGSNGLLEAKPVNRLLRSMKILTERGLEDFAPYDSREASKLAKYWDAVEDFVDEGDARALRQFRGKYVLDLNRVRHPFFTDLEIVDELANSGELSFESLYGRGK